MAATSTKFRRIMQRMCTACLRSSVRVALASSSRAASVKGPPVLDGFGDFHVRFVPTFLAT